MIGKLCVYLLEVNPVFIMGAGGRSCTFIRVDKVKKIFSALLLNVYFLKSKALPSITKI